MKRLPSESRKEELLLFGIRTQWEGQWAYTSKEEELNALAAQGQKGVRMDLNKIRLITAEGLTKD